MLKEKESSLEISGYNLNLDKVWVVATENKKVALADTAKAKVLKARAYLEDKMAKGDVMYGVNTGFGHFSNVQISDDQLVELQKNLIRSHCCGVGKPFTKVQSRAIMLLRANALSSGHSGVRTEVIEKILEFLNNDLIPVIPEQGSVGASGDLSSFIPLGFGFDGRG